MNYLLKRTMILNINKFIAILFLFSFITGKVVAGCDDPPGNEVDWNKFIKNPDLVMATKEIAAMKFQEYVLRKISSKKETNLKDNIKKKNNFD